MSSQDIAKSRLAELRARKFGNPPDKYILCITTPTHAYVVEGRKNFTEYNNREATNTAWFEFLLGLSQLKALSALNRRYQFSHFPPGLSVPEQYYGLTMQHLQDGTICFGGRFTSQCATNSGATTLELIEYFDELANMPDDETRAHLSEFGFGVYEK